MSKKLNSCCLADVKEEKISYLIDPFIPFGEITILQGDGGVGKTYAMNKIAADVTVGKPLLGGGATEPMNVVFQTAEDSYGKTIIKRFKKLGADLNHIFYIKEDDEGEALTLSDARIEQMIVRHNAKLCVIDPIQAFVSNISSAKVMRPHMTELKKIAERTGCAIVLIGHLNKSSGAKAAYRGLGSVDIGNAARSVLTFGKLSTEENTSAFIQTKFNVAQKGKPQAFRIDPEEGFVWLGDCDVTVEELLSGNCKRNTQIEKAQSLIETALADGLVPASKIEQLATEQSISWETMKRAKKSLGVTSLKPGGVWHWELSSNTERCEEGQGGQEGQEGQVGQVGQEGQEWQDCQEHQDYQHRQQKGHEHNDTTSLTPLIMDYEHIEERTILSEPEYRNKIICGDCLEIMRKLPDKCVDLVVTSPPYNIRNTTGSGMNASSRGKGSFMGKSELLRVGYDGHDDNMPRDEYIQWQRECLSEMMRVITDDGAIFYNHKSRVQGGLMQDCSEILAGFPVRQRIIWQRTGGVNFNKGYFLPTYEEIYLIVKPGFELVGEAIKQSDVWQFPPAKKNGHPAPFPIALPDRIISSTNAKIVLDPFMGSGTTAIAALQNGRDYIGIEQSQKYCDSAEKRIEDSQKARE